MKTTTTHLTKDQISRISNEEYNSLRDAYYKTAEGIASLANHYALLGTEEQKAMIELQSALSKLSGLGVNL